MSSYNVLFIYNARCCIPSGVKFEWSIYGQAKAVLLLQRLPNLHWQMTVNS